MINTYFIIGIPEVYGWAAVSIASVVAASFENVECIYSRRLNLSEMRFIGLSA